jgi:hypothetical protein
VPNVRGGEDFYKPGPKLGDVHWLERCFGPFQAGDLDIRVREGGGLWCVGPQRRGGLSMSDGLNPASELVMETEVAASFDVHRNASLLLQLLDEDDVLVGGPTYVVADDAEPGRFQACGREFDAASGDVVHVMLDPSKTGITCRTAAGLMVVIVGSQEDETVRVALVVERKGRPLLQDFVVDGTLVGVRLHNPRPGEL